VTKNLTVFSENPERICGNQKRFWHWSYRGFHIRVSIGCTTAYEAFLPTMPILWNVKNTISKCFR